MATVNDDKTNQQSITTQDARLLATTTKTPPQMGAITPRWLLRMLPWVNVNSGTYRVNRVKAVVPQREQVRIQFENGKAVITPSALRAMPEFAQVEDHIVESISTRFSNSIHERDEVIFDVGQQSDKFYLIARGKVEISTTGPQGQTLTLAVLGPGDHFGESSLIRQANHSAKATSSTETELLTLDRSDFEMVMNEVPGIRDYLIQLSEERSRLKSLAEQSGEEALDIDSGHAGESVLSEMFVDYETEPQEYPLNIAQSILRVHTRVSDLYNDPIDQLREQLRLTIEGIREKQEWEIVNHPNFGLRSAVAANMRVQSRYGPPTPDSFDELLAKVWKKPAFFLAHPNAIAAFGRECTRRGVPPATVQLFDSPFITWRGVPVIPCNKLELKRHANGPTTTDILLMRVGEKDQGVIGLHQTGIPGEVMPSLSVKFMGINQKAVASYLVTKYFSCASLTADALGVLENVEVDYFHEYHYE